MLILGLERHDYRPWATVGRTKVNGGLEGLRLLTKMYRTTLYPLRSICEIPEVDTPSCLAVSAANDTPYPLTSFCARILLNFGRGDLRLPD